MTMAEDELQMGPAIPQSWWAKDVLRAAAVAEQAPVERRLVAFLAALALETLRLVGAESDESGEAIACAAIALRALFVDPSAAASNEEINRWTSRVRSMLILEALQRLGYLHVDYGDSVPDPLSSDPAIQIIGAWTKFLQKPK